MVRRSVLSLVSACALALAAGAFPLAASAGDAAPYSPQAFAAAQNAGRPILIHITAPWCTVCAAQRPILSQLEAEPRFKTLAVFDVDFDTEKDVVKHFDARIQSTLISFKGAVETGRSAGATNPKAIEAVLAKAL